MFHQLLHHFKPTSTTNFRSGVQLRAEQCRARPAGRAPVRGAAGGQGLRPGGGARQGGRPAAGLLPLRVPTEAGRGPMRRRLGQVRAVSVFLVSGRLGQGFSDKPNFEL